MTAVLRIRRHHGPLPRHSLSLKVQRKGFTLIELLLVIGIIAILSGIIFAALSPTQQLGTSRDAKRRSDVNTILNAIYQYLIDEERLPDGIPTGTAQQICDTDSIDCDSGVNLDVLTGAYLVSIPRDPQLADTATGTHYFIVRDSSGRVTVSAPGAEGENEISVTR